VSWSNPQKGMVHLYAHAAIASHACGFRVKSRWELQAWQAGILIDALKDRISHAISRRVAA
jgi:hypothetical protein